MPHRTLVVFVCFSSLVWGCSASQKTSREATIDPDFARFCASNPCRGQTVVNLVNDDGTPYHLELPMAQPIVQPGFVSVYAGESIILEADVTDGGRLVNLRAAQRLSDPEKSIQLRFFQDTTMRNGSDMVLVITNGFPQAVKYRLGIMLPSDPEPPPGQPPIVRRTSACPVLPGKVSYEHWPHAIFQLVAADFRLVDPNDSAVMVCE
jgi:hypothetical protein